MTALQELEERARQAKLVYEQKCKDRTVAQKAHIKLITEAKTAYTTWEELETAALGLRLHDGVQPELVVVEGGEST